MHVMYCLTARSGLTSFTARSGLTRALWAGLVLVLACSSDSGSRDATQGSTVTSPSEESGESGSSSEASSGSSEAGGNGSGSGSGGGSEASSSSSEAETESTGVDVPLDTNGVFTVSSTNPEVLSQFQVLLALSPENFDYATVSENGDNIRFSTDGSRVDVSHWIERWTQNGDSRVWIKVPEIPANGSVDVYVLTDGSDGAESTSSGEAVFEYFDGFTDGDPRDRWQVYGVESAAYDNGRLVLGSDTPDWGSISIPRILAGAFVIHHRYSVTGPGGLAIGESPESNRYLFDVGENPDGTLGTSYFLSFPGTRENYDPSYPAIPGAEESVQDYSASVRITDGLLDVIDYCNLTSALCAGPRLLERFEEFGPFHFGLMFVRGELVLERFFIRKYADPAPTIE